MSRFHRTGEFSTTPNPWGFPILPYGARVRFPGFKHEEGSFECLYVILGLEDRTIKYPNSTLTVPCLHYTAMTEDSDEILYTRMDDVHLHGFLLLPDGSEVKLGKCSPVPRDLYDRCIANDSSEKNKSHLKERPWRYMPHVLARTHLSDEKKWVPKLAKFEKTFEKTSPIKDVDLAAFPDWQSCAVFLKSFLPGLSAIEIVDYCGRNELLQTKPAQKRERAQKSVKNFLSKNKDKINVLTSYDPANTAVFDISQIGINQLSFTQMRCRFLHQNRASDEVIRDVCFAGVVCGDDEFFKSHWKMWKNDRGFVEGMEKREWPEWCAGVLEQCLNVARTVKNDESIVRFLEREKREMKLQDPEEECGRLPFTAQRRVKPELLAFSRGMRDFFRALDMPGFTEADEKRQALAVSLIGLGMESFLDDVLDGLNDEDGVQGEVRGADIKQDPARALTRRTGEQQIPDETKRLLCSALNFFLVAVKLAPPSSNLLGVEAMTKCIDVLSMMRKSERIETVLHLFRDRCEKSSAWAQPYMRRKVLTDLAAFHHGSYRLADALACIHSVASATLLDTATDKIRWQILEARIQIDLGGFGRALELLEPISKMKWFDLDIAQKGRVGCWGNGMLDPRGENKQTQFGWLRSQSDFTANFSSGPTT